MNHKPAKYFFITLLRLVLALFASALTPYPARAGTTITVTRADDGTDCGPQPTGETLRCAITDANALGTFNHIQFAPSVTRVTLTDTLPTITSQGTYINGALPASALVTIDAAGIFGNVLEINASDVLIFDLSVINTPSNAVDIQILGGRAVRIINNYLGVIPSAADCSFSGHTRNSGIGVDVFSNAGSSTVGAAFISGNVIGCHASGGNGKGISIESSWTYVGIDADGSVHPNYIGVQPNGSHLPNDDGIGFLSGGGVFTATNNSVLSNTIAYNLVNGIELDGPLTSQNIISTTAIYRNAFDGICENNDSFDNVWTKVSIYGSGGLGINKQGNCASRFPGPAEAINPPFPLITAVNPSTHVVSSTATAGVQFFRSVSVELYRVFPNPRGFGEGETYIGSTTTDSNGNWSITDPAFSGGCYTAFQTVDVFFTGNVSSSEFGPNNCRIFLPLLKK